MAFGAPAGQPWPAPLREQRQSPRRYDCEDPAEPTVHCASFDAILALLALNLEWGFER